MPSKTDPLYQAWERANNIVTSWISRPVSPSIAQSILWIDEAYGVWDELRERFSQGNLFCVAKLQESIANFRQGELSVTNYFTKLKILFLRRFNDGYGSVRSKIMLVNHLPNMSRVFSLRFQSRRKYRRKFWDKATMSTRNKQANSIMVCDAARDKDSCEHDKNDMLIKMKMKNFQCQYISWILDSGSTHHISSSLSLFSSYYKIKPVRVNLPNSSAKISYIPDTIPLNQNLSIHNVLYLPNFSYNLLFSIPKLT
ncbi:hypothetical protein Lal_00035561 [Lupinus albus]|nr:hypothetical protein Lal_00035561 [Lupinus albus]